MPLATIQSFLSLTKDYQTLLAAIIALVAAGIAYRSARSAANISAGAQLAIATRAAERVEDDELRKRLAFARAISNSAGHLRRLALEAREYLADENRIRRIISTLPMDELEDEARERAVRYASLPVDPVLKSGWETMALLDINTQDALSNLNRDVDELVYLVDGMAKRTTSISTVIKHLDSLATTADNAKTSANGLQMNIIAESHIIEQRRAGMKESTEKPRDSAAPNRTENSSERR